MNEILLLSAIVLLLCIACSGISQRFGVPALFIFILLGMLFGTDGLGKIPFDNYAAAEKICSIALILIIFYGGFGTNWKAAKPVVGKAMLLSTFGVLVTAALTGVFCALVLKMSFLEGLLIGAIISSTDAASVFSILRSKKLNLKYNTASLLEIESGSNDPFAYMLTVLVLSFMGSSHKYPFLYLLFAQIVYGVVFGILFAYATLWVYKRLKFLTGGLDTIFMLAAVVMAYAVPTLLGGNGYLSVYLLGIILGNKSIKNKITLVHFFDGVTGLAQILIFFLLGLLSFPSQLPKVLLPSIAIVLFLSFLARPIAVAMFLTPAKASLKQQGVVNFGGLRGAASIVFAILAVTSNVEIQNDIFHIVFCVVLLSMAVQGTLLPLVSRKLEMVDDETNVLKTFNDYQEETKLQFVKLNISEGHVWENLKVNELHLPMEMRLSMLMRNQETVIPNGDLKLLAGDTAILCAPEFEEGEGTNLWEEYLNTGHSWIDKKIAELELPKDTLIILIKRGEETVVPNGETLLKEEDILVINTLEDGEFIQAGR